MTVDLRSVGRYYIIVWVLLILKHLKKRRKKTKKKENTARKRPIWFLNVSLFFYGQSGPHKLSIFKKSAWWITRFTALLFFFSLSSCNTDSEETGCMLSKGWGNVLLIRQYTFWPNLDVSRYYFCSQDYFFLKWQLIKSLHKRKITSLLKL